MRTRVEFARLRAILAFGVIFFGCVLAGYQMDNLFRSVAAGDEPVGQSELSRINKRTYYLEGQEPRPAAPTSAETTTEPVAIPAIELQRDQEQRRSESVGQAFANLDEKAQNNGTVRVIVGLRGDFKRESQLNARQIADQRRAIADAQEALLRSLPGYDAGSVKRFKFIPYLALEVNAGGLSALKASDAVISIQEDKQNRPLLAESTALIGAQAAWASGFTGAGQTVAILDTGVDKNHPFLAGKVVSEACYSTNGSGASSTCPGGVTQSTSPNSGLPCNASGCDHGTHVAGIAAGKGASFSGVARDARIIAIQVFSAKSDGDLTAFDSDIIRGLERVYELSGNFNIAAVNVSIGGGEYTYNCDSEEIATKAAIDHLRSAGIATIIASGNNSYTNALNYPACVSSAISVGSTGDGSNGSRLDGVSRFSNSASFLNLLAPGEGINSSVPGGGFENFNGTSMAAPHVAGAWAVMRSKSSQASVGQIFEALRTTGKPITDTRNGVIKPRIQLDAALNVLSGAPGGNTQELKLDDGTDEAGVQANGLMIVNRLTPTSYPSKLQTIRIFLAQYQSLPSPVGAQIRLIAFKGSSSAPSGNPTYLLDQTVTIPNITSAGFVDFNLANGPTINDGDWYIGFQAPNPAGGVVFSLDKDGSQQQRSFFSTNNGASFQGPLMTGNPPALANAMIRAVVVSGGPSPQPDETIALTSGAPQSGSLPAPSQSGSGVFGPTQYTIQLPAGATQLKVDLNGNQDVDLFVRFGQRVVIQNGQVVADHRAITLSGAESLTITSSSSPPLRTGVYYIAVSNFGPGAANFTITATVTTGSPGGQTEELKVDDGTSEGGVGGNGLIVVNRMKPSQYPSKLQTIRLRIGLFQGLPNPSGAQIRLLAYNVSASASSVNNSGYLLDQNATIPNITSSGFVDFNINNGPTITDGDWVIGYQAPNPYGGVAFSMDRDGQQQQRSFFSTNNGATFNPLISGTPAAPSNAMIRAVVSSGASTGSPRIEIDPALLDFGNVDVGATSDKTLTVRNAGTAALNVTGLTINNSRFSVTNPNGAFTLAPNAQQTVNLRFSPIAPGAQTGTLTISSNDSNKPNTSVQIGGTGRAQGGEQTIELTSGVTRSDSLPAPSQSGSGVLGSTQYSIQAPNGATQLRVDLSGDQDVDLFVRFGQRITVQQGEAIADFKSTSAGSSESITISPSTNPALQSGIYYICIANFGPGAANFTVTATVTTGGSQCSYVISPTSRNFSANGGAGTVSVMAGNGCNWTATSNANWVTINSGNQGSGNGAVNFTVAANGASNPRTSAMTIAGQTFTVTQDGAASNTNRIVRVGAASGFPGGAVTVPIELISEGDESALGFSLTFDPSALSNPQAVLGSDATGATFNTNTSQAQQGRFGILLSLPAGQRFSAGARQVAVVTFTINGGASAAATDIGFGDQPIRREVSDANANPLPANYAGGAVTFTTGFEADIAPRPTGNGSVTAIDLVQAGRFVAGLDTPAPGGEFQRADCAPKETRGNGSLTITDLVQAGRYAAGLDPLALAGGPTGPSAFSANTLLRRALSDSTSGPRTLRVIDANLQRGQQATIAIELDAQGNENTLGFSLSFDPAQLQFVSASIGSGSTGATLITNSSQASAGRLGFVISLPAGQSFTAGLRQIITITFTPSAGRGASATEIAFGDQPVQREVSDSVANALQTNYIKGMVTFTGNVAVVSAASFLGPSVASESIAAAFGQNLASGIDVANSLPLPTHLAGTTVKVRDSGNTERLAPLFFVAPSQVNYQIPSGSASGAATVAIVSGDGFISTGALNIVDVAPGLFSADASGQGPASAVVLRVRADSAHSYEPVAHYDSSQNKYITVPIDLGPETDQVFLLL